MADGDIPTAQTHPFAPRTLTRAMAARAKSLGIQLPKPRLRGVLHLIAFPTSLVAGLLLVAFGETFATRLACAVFVLTAGLLFGVSAVYHRGTWTPQRAIMRGADSTTRTSSSSSRAPIPRSRSPCSSRARRPPCSRSPGAVP